MAELADLPEGCLAALGRHPGGADPAAPPLQGCAGEQCDWGGSGDCAVNLHQAGAASPVQPDPGHQLRHSGSLWASCWHLAGTWRVAAGP